MAKHDPLCLLAGTERNANYTGLCSCDVIERATQRERTNGMAWLRTELEELRDVAEASRRKADAAGNWTASASYNGEWLGLTHALGRIDEWEDMT